MEKSKTGWVSLLTILSLFPIGGAVLYVLSIGHVVTLESTDDLLFMQVTIIEGLVLAITGICVTFLKRWYLFPALLFLSVSYAWTTYMGWGNNTVNAIILLVTVFLNLLYLRAFHELEKRDSTAIPNTN